MNTPTWPLIPQGHIFTHKTSLAISTNWVPCTNPCKLCGTSSVNRMWTFISPHITLVWNISAPMNPYVINNPKYFSMWSLAISLQNNMSLTTHSRHANIPHYMLRLHCPWCMHVTCRSIFYHGHNIAHAPCNIGPWYSGSILRCHGGTCASLRLTLVNHHTS